MKGVHRKHSIQYTFKGGAEYIYDKNEPPIAVARIIGKSCPACTSINSQENKYMYVELQNRWYENYSVQESEILSRNPVAHIRTDQ